MSIKYRLVQRKDLSKGAAEDAKKFYASVNNTGQYDFQTTCERIASYSTASRGDVMLVMDGLVMCLKEALLRGEVVQLGDLGNFQINVGSTGVATEEEFQVTMMRRPRILFRPGKILKEVLQNVSFEKLPVVLKECDKEHIV